MKIRYLLFALAVSLSRGLPPAKADGSGVRGGADLITCFESRYGVFRNESVFADIVGSDVAFKPHFFDRIELGDLENRVLEYIRTYEGETEYRFIKGFFTDERFQFSSVPLDPIETGLNLGGMKLSSPIFYKAFDENADIDGAPFEIQACMRKQVGEQDFSSRTVTFYLPYYETLTSIEKVFLKLHEAYLYEASLHLDDVVLMEREARAKVKDVWEDDHLNAVLLPASSELGEDGADDITKDCLANYPANPFFAPLNWKYPLVERCINQYLSYTNFSNCAAPFVYHNQPASQIAYEIQACRLVP